MIFGEVTWMLILTACYVGATAVYAYLTWHIWKVSRQQGEVLERQTIMQQHENDRQSFIQMTSLLEAGRADRAFVHECIRAGVSWRDVPPDQLEKVDRVCRQFDIVGALDRLHLVSSLAIDVIYASAFVELYEGFLRDYVNDVRSAEQRGMLHFWELVQFYERVRWVPHNHPAATGAAFWHPQHRRPPPGEGIARSNTPADASADH